MTDLRKALERIAAPSPLACRWCTGSNEGHEDDCPATIAHEALASEPESASVGEVRMPTAFDGVPEAALDPDDDGSQEVLEILCRAFDDDPADMMQEWTEWYDPAEWLCWSRALGAFIRKRLATHAKPPKADGWHWMCSCGESGHIGPKDFCPACGNAIEANRPWAYIPTPTGESE